MTNDKWTKLEDKIYSAAKTAKSNKYIIDSDVAPPTVNKPLRKIENCGQTTAVSAKAKANGKKALVVTAEKPWPSAHCGQLAASKKHEIAIRGQKPNFEIDLDVVELKRADTGREQSGRWVKGQSGNPTGKKSGTKNRVSSAMREVVLAEVNNYAAEVLARIRDKDPTAWVMIMLRFVPAELVLKLESGKHIDYSELDDSELMEYIEKRDKHQQITKVLDRHGGAEH